MWILSARAFVILTTKWRRGTPTVWPKFNSIIIICFSTFSHHLRHHHRTIISGQDHTVSSFLRELDISVTLTFYQHAFQKRLLTFTALISIVFSFPDCCEIAFCQLSTKRILDWIGLAALGDVEFGFSFVWYATTKLLWIWWCRSVNRVSDERLTGSTPPYTPASGSPPRQLSKSSTT